MSKEVSLIGNMSCLSCQLPTLQPWQIEQGVLKLFNNMVTFGIIFNLWFAELFITHLSVFHLYKFYCHNFFFCYTFLCRFIPLNFTLSFTVILLGLQLWVKINAYILNLFHLETSQSIIILLIYCMTTLNIPWENTYDLVVFI